MTTQQTPTDRVSRELPRLLEVAVRHAAAGNPEEGRKMLWALVRLAPRSVECWQAFAAVLHRQGNGVGAAIAVDRALELDPTFAMAHALKADLLLCAAQVDAAADHLARAVAHPDRMSPEMHRWAASMHRRLTRPATVN